MKKTAGIFMSVLLAACGGIGALDDVKYAPAASSSIEQQAAVDENIAMFIDRIKTNDREDLANNVKYPFERPYPLPPIKNESEFMAYYNLLFDDELIKKIIESNPKKDWDTYGWRGIMFENIWLDYDGRLKAIDRLTDEERKLWNTLKEKDRLTIHSSLKNFENNVFVLKTDKFIIRIDNMGNDKYRYASWDINKTTQDKPDIILLNGVHAYDGSGGNNSYTFKNGDYSYIVSETIVGAMDSPPYDLEIIKNGKRMLYLPASKLEIN